MSKIFNYLTKEKEQKSIVLEWDNLNLYLQANKYYESSRAHIMSEYYYIWKWGYKAYHLSTKDRQQYIKSWQSNVAFGFIRAFIDVFTSTLTERPINFVVKAYDEEAVTNASNVEHALTVNADITGFNEESKKILNEWLKTGSFCVRISYIPEKEKQSYISIVNGVPMERSYTPEFGGFPNAKHVDVFKIFPDPSSWPLRYVTERDVLSLEDALKIFSGLIKHKSNKSPFKDQDFVKCISLNKNGADHTDYGIVRNEVHREINEQLEREDSFNTTKQPSTTSTTTTHDQDTNIMEGMVEYKYTTTNDMIVLQFNGYPVYIGDNIFGFIPYVIKATNSTDVRMGCEWVPYLLRGMETTLNSHMNNYIDSVKAVASPTFIGRKGAFIDESAVEDLWPGDVLWADMEVWPNVLTRMDKWGVSDHNIFDICTKIAQQITGISEYNLGISARERTATGANATTQSSQKRLSPFLSSYLTVMSQIAKMWVKIMIDNWTKEKMLMAFNNNNGTVKFLKNSDLVGLFKYTVDMDSMFSSKSDLEYKKLIEVWTQLKGSNLIKENEVVRQMFTAQGLSPDRFVPPSAPEVTPPSETPPPPITDESPNTPTDMEQMLTEAVSPQPDLGNEWNWQA